MVGLAPLRNAGVMAGRPCPVRKLRADTEACFLCISISFCSTSGRACTVTRRRGAPSHVLGSRDTGVRIVFAPLMLRRGLDQYGLLPLHVGEQDPAQRPWKFGA